MFLVLGGKLVHQFGDIKPAGHQPEVVFDREEPVDGLRAGDGIYIMPAQERDVAVGEEFQVPGHAALGFAQALGKPLYLAEFRRKQSEDRVRLAEFGLADDDGFCLVFTRFRHKLLLTVDLTISFLALV
jgi:hypothetical protein